MNPNYPIRSTPWKVTSSSMTGDPANRIILQTGYTSYKFPSELLKPLEAIVAEHNNECFGTGAPLQVPTEPQPKSL